MTDADSWGSDEDEGPPDLVANSGVAEQYEQYDSNDAKDQDGTEDEAYDPADQDDLHELEYDAEVDDARETDGPQYVQYWSEEGTP